MKLEEVINASLRRMRLQGSCSGLHLSYQPTDILHLIFIILSFIDRPLIAPHPQNGYTTTLFVTAADHNQQHTQSLRSRDRMYYNGHRRKPFRPLALGTKIPDSDFWP